ncbi:hypothetical protein BDV12DRAFT_145675 [Aspergillus spectabilis]
MLASGGRGRSEDSNSVQTRRQARPVSRIISRTDSYIQEGHWRSSASATCPGRSSASCHSYVPKASAFAALVWQDWSALNNQKKRNTSAESIGDPRVACCSSDQSKPCVLPLSMLRPCGRMDAIFELLHVLELRDVGNAGVFGGKDRIPGSIGFETER